MSRLLEHFKQMQRFAASYLEPTPTYVNRDGDITEPGPLERVQRNHFFVADMIYMLDGPEQRAAEAAAEGHKVGDGSGDAALAIGEHAFRAGVEYGLKAAKDEGFAGMSEAMVAQAMSDGWSGYDPSEEIKALS